MAEVSMPGWENDRDGRRVPDRETKLAEQAEIMRLTDCLMGLVPPGAMRDQAFAEVRTIARDKSNAYTMVDAFKIVIAEHSAHAEVS